MQSTDSVQSLIIVAMACFTEVERNNSKTFTEPQKITDS